MTLIQHRRPASVSSLLFCIILETGMQLRFNRKLFFFYAIITRPWDLTGSKNLWMSFLGFNVSELGEHIFWAHVWSSMLCGPRRDDKGGKEH